VLRASHEHEQHEPVEADEEMSLPVSNGGETEAAVDGPAATVHDDVDDVQVTLASLIVSCGHICMFVIIIRYHTAKRYAPLQWQFNRIISTVHAPRECF